MVLFKFLKMMIGVFFYKSRIRHISSLGDFFFFFWLSRSWIFLILWKMFFFNGQASFVCVCVCVVLKLEIFALYSKEHFEWKSLSRVQLFATPWSTVHGTLQTRILERIAFPFSRGSSQPGAQTKASCIAGGLFPSWAVGEALKDILKEDIRSRWLINYRKQ